MQSGTTESHLFLSEGQTTEFSIKKGLAMDGYSHAVMPALAKEMEKMFVNYKALQSAPVRPTSRHPIQRYLLQILLVPQVQVPP